MENRVIRQTITEKGKKEICAGIDEEWVVLGKAGSIRGTVLPGCSRTLLLEEGDRLIGMKRHAVFSDVVGCGHMMDPDGNAWGAWFRFSLRLIAPRRFAGQLEEGTENAGELSSFKKEIREAMKEIFRGMLLEEKPGSRRGNREKTYIQRVRAFFEEAAERYGLEALDFAEGGLSGRGGA